MMVQYPAQLMIDILDRVQTIDNLVLRIMRQKFFRDAKVRLPKFEHPELGMLRSVSWLYALYQELGKPNIDFVKERFSVYSLDTNDSKQRHIATLQSLRTYFQHSLDPLTESDSRTQKTCENWFRSMCGIAYPETDEQWKRSMIGILTEANDFLICVHKCIEAIDLDEAREQILQQWEHRLIRHHPQHKFDHLIAIIAPDLGRDGIKPKNFSNIYYAKWLQQLDILDTYEFETEARRLIERAILEDTRPRMPITGTDIMNEFSLAPGKKVGNLLKRGTELLDKNPNYSKSELLDILREEIHNID